MSFRDLFSINVLQVLQYNPIIAPPVLAKRNLTSLLPQLGQLNDNSKHPVNYSKKIVLLFKYRLTWLITID